MIWAALFISLKVTAAATLLIFVLGGGLALLLARRPCRGSTLVETAIHLPLVLPPSVVGYYLLIGLGREGPLVRWLDVHLLFTWPAAVVASTVVGLPLMFQAARAAIAAVDPTLEHAARTLGCTELQVLWRVTLPLARRGLLAGLALGATRALGEFGATLMVAGNIPGKTQTIPLAIYFAVETGDNILARNLVLVITGLSIAALFWLNLWSRKKVEVWQQGGNPHAQRVHS